MANKKMGQPRGAGGVMTPQDIRLLELHRREHEEKEWIAKAGPVTVRRIDTEIKTRDKSIRGW